MMASFFSSPGSNEADGRLAEERAESGVACRRMHLNLPVCLGLLWFRKTQNVNLGCNNDQTPSTLQA